MSFNLSATSLGRLRGVAPDLVRVVDRAAHWSPVEFIVVEGLRSRARQAQLYAQGRTAPGKIVTWTLRSKHIEGRAVDLAPIRDGAILWNDLAAFDKVAGAMMTASRELGVAIRWGANWDGDDRPREKGEVDSPHFELA